MYLYHAGDSSGGTVEYWLSERCNSTATRRILSNALKRHGQPERIVIDGSQINLEVILSCDMSNQRKDRSERKLKPIRIGRS